MIDERMGFVVNYYQFSPLSGMSFKFITAKRIVNIHDNSYDEFFLVHIHSLILLIVHNIKTKLTISCECHKYVGLLLETR